MYIYMYAYTHYIGDRKNWIFVIITLIEQYHTYMYTYNVHTVLVTTYTFVHTCTGTGHSDGSLTILLILTFSSIILELHYCTFR